MIYNTRVASNEADNCMWNDGRLDHGISNAGINTDGGNYTCAISTMNDTKSSSTIIAVHGKLSWHFKFRARAILLVLSNWSRKPIFTYLNQVQPLSRIIGYVPREVNL